MINFIKQKNDMKKLAYIVITSSMFLTTSCVDLTQEPQSFITEGRIYCTYGFDQPATSYNRALQRFMEW